jgi:hypothetical protein
MRRNGARKGQWIFWVIALFGWFAPAGVLATSENLLVNGNFSANEGGWVGASGGASCSGGSPSLGIWGGEPQLTFSYVQNSVTQQASIASPSELELSFLANGPNGGTYSATISDSDQSVTTGVLTAGENQVSNLGITTTQNDEVVTITFAGKDSLFWAGCYGPVIRNASLTVIAQPTSLVVTSLLDDGSVGTLRWAINQANAISGGIYDSITFGIDGTVSLTSALPQITQSVTVTGNGIANTIIDGNNSYRLFDVRTARTLTISNMTLKRGQSTSGGLIYINNGTVNASNMRLTSMTGGSAVFTSNNFSYATYTDSTFDNLSVGIAGDWGNTPSLGNGVTSWDTFDDSGFSNRTYVIRGQFTNNTYAINNYRFTKIEDSTFTNNTYAAFITGWNRSQVYGSTFTNNTVAIYHSATITGNANMGTDNRIIVGNSFVNNTSAIVLSDQYQVGGIIQKNQNSAKISNNNWDVNALPGAKYITYYQFPDNTTPLYALPDSTGVPWSGTGNSVVTTTTTTTTTTTIPTPTFSGGGCGPYNRITVTGQSGGSIWGDGPYTDDSNFGVAAVHAGLIDVGETAILEPYGVDNYPYFYGTTRNGVTTSAWGSGWCGFYIKIVGTETPEFNYPGATTTTTTTTTITPEPEPTDPPDTTQPEPEPTEPPDTTEPEPEPSSPPDTITKEPDTTDGGTDGGTGNSEDTTSPETTVPESAPEEETPDTTPELPVEEETSEAVVDDILADDPSPEELADAVGDALAATESEEELVSVATELLTSDLDPEQFAAVIDEVFSQDLSDEALAELVTTVFEQDLSDEEIAAVVGQVFTADISDEAFAEVLNTVFEEPLSNEAFDSVIDAILDEPISDAAFDELVDVLGGDSVSDEQVVAAVDAIIENGISEAQSVSIATSGEVLESITGDQASEIFATVPIGDISDAEAAALVEAVQDAPTEVKEAFEEEINIFAAGNVDTYVPLGSSIPVSTRRVLIAGTALTLTMIPIPVQVSPSRVGK